MNFIYLDYLASKQNTILHTLSLRWKLILLLLIFFVILFSPTWIFPFITYLFIVFFCIVKKIPFLKLFSLTVYPLIFTGVLLVSYQGLTLSLLLFFIFKVLLATTSVVIFLATTPFPVIFSFLSKFCPPIIVSAFFLTYRSIFILNTVFSDLQTGLYLRGGLRTKNPLRKIRNVGILLGQLIILASEKSERLSSSLYVRGWRGKIYG
jgi:energy-coupling factor transporter transmembrane protein EcfT